MFWFWSILGWFFVHFLWFLAFVKSAENVRNSKVGHESTLYCSDFDDFGVVRKQDFRIKTWPRIDLRMLGFWRAWRRSKAEIVSFQTTPKSSKTDQYNVDSWSTFEFRTFSVDFKNAKNRKKCTYNCTKIHQNQNMAMTRPYIVRFLVILALFESWRSQLSNGAKIIKNRAI